MTKKVIDFSVINAGPLSIDPRHKKPGFDYMWVGDLPGQLAYYQRLGFEIVKDEAIDAGDNHAANASKIGSAVTVKSKDGQTMYLMAVESDIYQQLLEYRNKVAAERLKSVGRLSDTPEHLQIGEVKYGKTKL